ncbi:MAG: hypothetical protein FJ388_11440, partial [Verrucomicrobia bacterium]|nr:hypothetical protein [Verrucomicrobiota bacterium]
MKRTIVTVMILGAIAAAFYVGRTVGPLGPAGSAHATVKYHCPMHPTVIQDRPGDCPICGMKLVPMGEGGAAGQAAKTKTMYRSTMNQNEVSDKPGKDSMGLDMIPFEVTEGGVSSSVPGLAVVSITPQSRQLMG